MYVQRGNALFLILIAVALFAALSYAITRSGNGAVKTDREELALRSASALSYGQSTRAAVQRLLVLGCSETQLSFEHPSLSAGYVNPSSPPDFSCHIFRPEGGGIAYSPAEVGWRDNPCDAPDGCPNWVFVGSLRMPGIGVSANNDLVAYLPDIDRALCRAINTRVGIDNPMGAAPTDNFGGGGGAFSGSYSASATFQLGDEVPALAGHWEYCVQRTNGIAGNHFFFVVLHAR